MLMYSRAFPLQEEGYTRHVYGFWGFAYCRLRVWVLWYARQDSLRTAYLPIIKLITSCNICRYNPNPKRYRNPVIYAQELQKEMLRGNLTRRQLGERHGVSSDRITQWLCLLKLPEDTLREIESLGDHWDRQVVTERKLRGSQKR